MHKVLTFWLTLFLVSKQPVTAYSFQSHEELIDLNWKTTIRPVLLRHYPGASEAELERAHAYAYGGCAIQDLGYYPFSHAFFSNLTHYVRSADFIRSLFKEANNPEELAFAIGALSHYVGDVVGHYQAVNPAVAREFPALAWKYGPRITYDENPRAHVRVEFAFDVNEISKHRMAPSAYLRHVGLEVPTAFLARAFADTYGLQFEGVLGKRRGTVRSYRFAVRSFLPRIAYAEIVLHRRGFPPDVQSDALRIFEKHLADADFQSGWNQYRKKAGIGTHLLAWTVAVLPKVGPLSLLAIRGPSADTEQVYLRSMNAATDMFRRLLMDRADEIESMPNRDLDTGEKVRPGGYRLTDETYAKLLHKITHATHSHVSPELTASILDYYSDEQAPITTKDHKKQWATVQVDLAELRKLQSIPKTAVDAKDRAR